MWSRRSLSRRPTHASTPRYRTSSSSTSGCPATPRTEAASTYCDGWERPIPYVPVVIVTASSEIDSIRQAMRLGAKDYVLKDELSPELLLPIVDGFRERMALRGEVARLRERIDREFG